MRWPSVVVMAASLACFTDAAPDDPPTETDSGPTTSSASSTTEAPTSTTATSTTPTTASSDESSSTGGAPECVSEGGVDEACRDDAPYCVAGTCRPCGDLPIACEEIDPSLPICHADTGVCSACESHEECASGACRIATGACFPESNRLWVDAGANCAAADGSEALPFCTVGGAFATVDMQPGGEPWAVFLVGGAQPHDLDPGAVLPERPFALIGPSRGLAAGLRGAAPRSLGVYGAGIDRYLAGLTFAGGFESTSLECSTGDLWGEDLVFEQGDVGLAVVGCDVRFRRVTIREAATRGVEVFEAGSLTLEESSIQSNSGAMFTEGTTTLRRSSVRDSYQLGGVSVVGGTFTASNTVFHANAYAIGHIDVSLTSVVSLDYVVAIGAPLSCTSATSTLAIRNSIVDDITCTLGTVTVDQSLVAPGFEGLGEGNVGFPAVDYAQVFDDHLGGDYHVVMDPPAYVLGVAMRSASDPSDDFDGDLRPDIGEPDYPGIDAAP